MNSNNFFSLFFVGSEGCRYAVSVVANCFERAVELAADANHLEFEGGTMGAPTAMPEGVL